MSELVKADEKQDFRGKLLIEDSYSHRSNFVEQVPLSDMVPALEEAFAQGILAIKWHQYVPGFNDGEPCEFTIGDIHATANPEVLASWINGSDFSDDYDEEYIVSSWLAKHPESHPDDVDWDIFPEDILATKYEYALRAEFGDDREIVITRDTTYTFEYDCGY